MAKRKAVKRKPIKRVTRHFQLRVGERYPVDAHVQEILEYKRSKRAEVTTIRDGVRLLWALENDDLSVLFDLFPQYKKQFVPDGITLIEQIQAALQQTNAVGQVTKQPTGFGLASGRKIDAPQFELPTFEDEGELPTIAITQSAASDAGMNLLAGLAGLGQK